MADDCGISNATLLIVDQLHFLSYMVLNQIYLTLGLLGNIILLVAFYKQSKTEKAYGYQILLTVSKLLEVLSFSTFLTTLKCFSGAENQDADWFINNYMIMYLTARLGPVAHMVFIVTSLLLTLAMTADRLFALTKPFVYKNINRTKHQLAAALICFLIGLFSSVSDAWRYDLGRGENNRAKLVSNEIYVKSDLAIFGAHIRTLVRVVGVLGLFVINIAVTVIFRKRSKRVGQMTKNNDQKEIARKKAEKNLLLINVYQSILMAINQIPHMCYHVLAYLVPSFTRCVGMMYSPTADAMVMLTDSVDLFLLMAVNKRMRRTVAKAFLCDRCAKDDSGKSVGADGATLFVSSVKKPNMTEVG